MAKVQDLKQMVISSIENDNVWKPIDKAKIPSNSKVLTSTWALKKKASGKF